MNASQLKLTYIGGPTALLEFGGRGFSPIQPSMLREGNTQPGR